LQAANRFELVAKEPSVRILKIFCKPIGGEAVMSESNEVPLSANAQEAKEMMHQQLMRKMANKMMAAAIEEERQRRIQSEKEEEEDAVRRKAFDQLVVVQEDLVRCLNLMKVSSTRGESSGGRSAARVAALGIGY